MRLSLPDDFPLKKQGYQSNKTQLKKPLYLSEVQFDE